MNSYKIERGKSDGLINSQCEFNKKCRRISIKNMPHGISNQDIADLLKPYHYQQIHIDKTSQSCKAVLLDGDSARRCMTDLNLKMFRGFQLNVSLACCDFMLCITQLPPFYTHDQFLTLITPFGTPERCFLVHSEISGQSKGYGCVEFTSKESSIRAKNHLNGKSVGISTLQVHWLDTIPIKYSGLHSRCLLVENLPKGFKDSGFICELFSQDAVKPIFCQISNCLDNDFAVVEFANYNQSEECWTKMNQYELNGSLLHVSFCVPGPCGLVILNSLKASRDLKRNNPSGGLLPTPTHKIDPHQQNLINTVLNPQPASTINGALSHALSHNDPEVQRLLKALQVRLQHVPPDIEHNQERYRKEYFNTMNCQVYKNAGNQLISEGKNCRKTGFEFNGPMCQISNPLIPMQCVRGRSASYDSGVQAIDDEVFSSSNSSQEDMRQFPEYCETYKGPNLKQNGTWKSCPLRKNENNHSPEIASSAFSHRSNNLDANGRRKPWNYQQGICGFQQEELQRSESADSAYGGSQESTSSSSDILLERAKHLTDVPHTLSDHGMQTIFLTSNPEQSQIVEDHPSFQSSKEKSFIRMYPNRKGLHLTQIVPTNPIPMLATKTLNKKLEKNSDRAIEFHSNSTSTFTPCQQLPKVSSASIPSSNGGISSSNSSLQNGIPRPEFLFSSVAKYENFILKQGDPGSLPIFTSNPSICSGYQNFSKSQISKLQGNCTNPAFLHHRSRSSTTPVQEICTPRINRKTSFSSIAADLHDIGADSPTQLQLLGSSLMEGLLADSPRSVADSLSESINGCGGAGRLIRALNLFSPHECLSSPHTPTSARKRGFRMLPSPEPSPEAGAYVGQHSQGLGGHYADAIPLNILSHKRRRSNET